MKTNSNTYTIVYSAVMVLIVAFLLAFVYTALKDKQDANVLLDKKKQILYSLNIRNLGGDEATEQIYRQTVKKVKHVTAEDSLYECKVNGEVKYVIPMKGMGLWGGISGFLAINGDKATVYGAYFNHESETAGLGAEIKDNIDWQKKFQGKKIFGQRGNKVIALSVAKKVEHPENEVDAVTGATLTSNGVTEMLHSCLSKYIQFLNEK